MTAEAVDEGKRDKGALWVTISVLGDVAACVACLLRNPKPGARRCPRSQQSRRERLSINDMISEPLDNAFRTRCRTCGATVWQYPTAKGQPVLLENAPGGYVIDEGEALRATQGAGYRTQP